jgi:hypothetical protein
MNRVMPAPLTVAESYHASRFHRSKIGVFTRPHTKADVGSFVVGDAKTHRRPCLLLEVSRQRLDVDLLGYLYRVIDLDVEIPNGALDLRMANKS